MMKMMTGGSGSHEEAYLMVTEKVHAMFEAGASLMAGGTASSLVDRYREHVAANAKRAGSGNLNRTISGISA
jgi:2-iminoacetate synthase ThiH